jgi:hypothetical protein
MTHTVLVGGAYNTLEVPVVTEVEMPEDAPAPPIDPADLPEVTDVDPVETVHAPKD